MISLNSYTPNVEKKRQGVNITLAPGFSENRRYPAYLADLAKI
tara:strand:- start:961 stop:1089 length:129 start_codon:yes stop_codon:yes gene_type:complete